MAAAQAERRAEEEKAAEGRAEAAMEIVAAMTEKAVEETAEVATEMVAVRAAAVKELAREAARETAVAAVANGWTPRRTRPSHRVRARGSLRWRR